MSSSSIRLACGLNHGGRVKQDYSDRMNRKFIDKISHVIKLNGVVNN